MTRFRRVAVLLVCLSAGWGQGPPASTQEPGAKIWVGRYQEIEEYLRTAECVSMEVFAPNRAARCTLRLGGPVARIAWRPVPPGLHRGFWESYKSEIAAYQVDKLLKMDMVPPTVERQLQGTTGAAQLWVENIVGVKAGDSPGEPNRTDWEIQVTRMSMFDNLIGNKDRNWGNTLRDAAWHLILIDHTRAFGAGTELPRRLSRIDGAFWTRIESLTRNQLDAALGAWLDEKQIAAILDRRERMRADLKVLER
jgi:hypothetical protein